MSTAEIQFGPFRLAPRERLLSRDGAPINIGGRALAILMALIDRPGEIVSKQQLLAQVWPDVTVDEGSLRFNIASLRKILGDGQDGARYVTNVAGRGYCFVAPVLQGAVPARPATTAPREGAARIAGRLPPLLRRMVGRDTTVAALSDNLMTERFVSIVGAGGIGKTTVAVAVGHAMLEAFDGEVAFVDLGALTDPALVPSALASVLGLVAQAADPVASLVAFLRDKRLLLILDSCEHVVEAAAPLAEAIFAESAAVHILATSREPLRVEGEHVHRLLSLDYPPQDDGLTAQQALSFPAAQLFVERISASLGQFELSDADAALVAGICRRLDGMALAIELTAGRVATFGLAQTATLLDDRLRLLWQGRRTALPRHQTLNATLDWSFDLLDEPERIVLRRLSMFTGSFGMEAAQDVAADDDLDHTEIVEIVASLVNKSLTLADTSGAAARYRLLDTTRAYAREKLTESGETHTVEARHARFYAAFMDRLEATAGWLDKPERIALFSEHLGNVRAALEWSFSPRGEAPVAVALAAAAAPVFVDLSLLGECRIWCERAIAVIDGEAGRELRGTPDELELQASLAMSLMFTQGNGEDVRRAFTRGLELAKKREQPLREMRLLSGFQIYLTRISDFDGALALAEQSRFVADGIADPAGVLMANWMVGVTQHLIGQQDSAWQNCASALTHGETSRWISQTRLGYDHRIIALVAAARALWLRGYPDQAVEAAHYTIDEAGKLEYPLTLAIALVWAAYVFFWIGDLDSAAAIISRLEIHAAKYSLGPYRAVAVAQRGKLDAERGQLDTGVTLLEQGLDRLRANKHQILDAAFISDLALALSNAGRHDRAQKAIALAIETAGKRSTFHIPEMHRVNGVILAARPAPDFAAAERCLQHSLGLARRQSAMSWELRAATSLARIWQRQGLRQQADALLRPLYDRFTEGFSTADLVAAKNLLDELAAKPHS